MNVNVNIDVNVNNTAGCAVIRRKYESNVVY